MRQPVLYFMPITSVKALFESFTHEMLCRVGKVFKGRIFNRFHRFHFTRTSVPAQTNIEGKILSIYLIGQGPGFHLCVLCVFKKGNHKEHREKCKSFYFKAKPPLCILCGFKKGNHGEQTEKY